MVAFAGYTITSDILKPTDNMLKVIEDFSTRTSIKGIPSWFGVIAFVSFAFSSSRSLSLFRELLKPKKKFYWDETLDLFSKQNPAKSRRYRGSQNV